jgi:erythromycin esterase
MPCVRSFRPSHLVAAILVAAAALPTAGDKPAQQPLDALRDAARPLRDESTLDPLLERIGSARAVLLGEASHGTREFYTWRAAISRRLIEEKNFVFIAVEGDWGACARVNRYVKHLPGAAESGREALMSFDRWPRWMWANEETLELVEWLHDFNKDRPADQRVGFYGIDVYGCSESIKKGPAYLRQIDGEAADMLAEALGCLVPYADDPQQYLHAIIHEGVNCEPAIRAAVDRLRTLRAVVPEHKKNEWFHAKQNAIVVKRAERHYRAMMSRGAGSWNARAEHFHGTFARLLDHYGQESRGIVWAHNTHIGDARATPMADQGMVNIGRLARESLGEDNVVLAGFATHRGRVLAAPRWQGPRQEMTVPRALGGSVEDLLNQLGKEASILLMADLAEAPAFSNRLWRHRAIGVTYDPLEERGNYVPSLLTRRYDVIIFIAETAPLTPLHESE